MGATQYFHSFSSGLNTGKKSYHQGTPVSGEVAGLFAIALNGQTFLIDEKVGVRRNSIPLLRSQADTSNLRGEASINPEELWRRAQETWHHGAGQTYLDRPESDPGRFRSSKGIDVWDKWQLSLLPETDQKRTSAFTNLALLAVGTHLYLAEGPEVFFTTDITVDSPTWTDTNVQAGEGDRTVESITTDGFNVWAALTSNGIHTTTRGASSWTHFGNNPTGRVYYLVGFVKGRLMAAADHRLYNITASGAAPTALNEDFANTDFRWVAFAEGPGHIYAAGFSGDKSKIYRTAVRSDGVALDAPVVAGELPDGEIIRAIQGYLGFMVLGTDRGVRFATIDGTGNLVIGQLIDDPAFAVECFEPQGRFVWFGWTNIDGDSTGLGRLDLSVFTDPLKPAYATDIYAGSDASGAGPASYVDLPGTSGNYVSTPDSAALSITGDIDLRIKVAMDDWTPAAESQFVSKDDNGGAIRAWQFRVETNGTIGFIWFDSAGGVHVTTSTTSTSLVDGSVKWVRATLDVDNGAAGRDIKFYLSDDGVSWSQLGATVTEAGTTNIRDTMGRVTIGAIGTTGAAGMLAGNVYYAEIRNGIDGTVVGRFDVSATEVTGSQTPTAVASSTGETWTINGTGWAWNAVSVQGAVTSVVTFQDRRVFTVSSVGVFAEEATFGAVGRIDSGLITYGMPDDKVAVLIDLNHEPLPTASDIEVLLATDEGSFVALGTDDRDGDTARTFSAKQETGSRFEVRVVLDAGTVSPVLTRYTLRSYPAFDSGEIIVLPLLLYERVEIGDVLRHQDPKGLFDTIKSMKDSHRLVNLQMADESFPVFVEDFEWATHHRTIDNMWWQGTLSLKIKRVS